MTFNTVSEQIKYSHGKFNVLRRIVIAFYFEMVTFIVPHFEMVKFIILYFKMVKFIILYFKMVKFIIFYFKIIKIHRCVFYPKE